MSHDPAARQTEPRGGVLAPPVNARVAVDAADGADATDAADGSDATDAADGADGADGADAAALIELRLSVPPRFDGRRLDHFIAWRIPRLSRNRIQQMIRSQAALGGVALRPASRVHAGQVVRLLRPALVEPDVPRRFGVLYQDEHVLAIDKPAGLPVHATARFHKNTLTALLRERFAGGPVPVMAHRLDRETSGLLLLGVTRPAAVALKRAFRERLVHKRYLALTYGRCPDEGVIDLPLQPDTVSGIRIRMLAGAGGLPSRTCFRVLGRRVASSAGRAAALPAGAEVSLVEAAPETGRQHQIRAHLAAIGHPVIGDKLYGQPPEVWLEYIATGWTERLAERLVLPRHALHAAGVELPHPASGAPLRIACPLADDLVAFWEGL